MLIKKLKATIAQTTLNLITDFFVSKNICIKKNGIHK